MEKQVFIEKSKLIHGNKYDYSLVPEKFVAKEKIKIICNIHGEFKKTANDHLYGKSGCKICSNEKVHNKLRKGTEKFIEESKLIHNDKYDYSLVNYKNWNTKVKIICPIHGIFEQVPNSHTSAKKGCEKCGYDKLRFNTKDFITKSKKIHNNKYDYSLIDYKQSHIKVKIICPIHGIFEQSPYLHLNGYNCMKCRGEEQRFTTEEFTTKSNLIHNYKYDYTKTIYETIRKNVIIICPLHGEFSQKPQHHLLGYGCHKCKESIGENKINIFLENNNINFIKQFKFDDCKYKSHLLFDFYLTDYNMCIEFDGEQHFRSVDFFGGEKSYEKILLRDKIKNEYCKNNNIRLIRINYNENIEEKLNYYLPGLSTDPAK